jgi:hypothetical protein
VPFLDLTHGILIFGDPGTGKTPILEKIVERNENEGTGVPFVVWERQGFWLPRRGKAPFVRAVVPTAEKAAQVAIRVANEEGGCTLVIDEASLAFPHDNPPREGSALFEIALIGRNPQAFGKWRRRGPVSLVAAAQYPRTCAPILRNCVNRYYLGRIEGESDLAWILEATKKKELVERVSRLPKRRFIVHDRE